MKKAFLFPSAQTTFWLEGGYATHVQFDLMTRAIEGVSVCSPSGSIWVYFSPELHIISVHTSFMLLPAIDDMSNYYKSAENALVQFKQLVEQGE